MPKDIYDNCTNNVRRYKLINLMNRYTGYGVMSEDMAAGHIYPRTADEKLLKIVEERNDVKRQE